jgi:hypothetical protein
VTRPPPVRHWQSYGNDLLPTPQEAMQQPFSAFPSWVLRIDCDRCGKANMINEAHMTAPRRVIVLHVLLSRCAMTAAAGDRAGPSFRLASTACRPGRCGGSCCRAADVLQMYKALTAPWSKTTGHRS